MEIVFVVQPSDQIFHELEQAIVAYSSDLLCLRIKDTGEAAQIIKKFLNDSFEEEEVEKYFSGDKPDSFKIRLFVLDVESIAHLDVGIFEKMQKMLLNTPLGDEENPPGFLLTDSTPEDVEMKKFLSPYIRNLIVTPFDPMTLKGFIKAAFDGNAPISTDLYTHKCSVEIEMLKSVHIKRLTELGFRTLSKREIAVGRKAKYLGKVFGDPPNHFVFAQCYTNRPQENGLFESSFSFFGVSQDHLNAIRKDILQASDSYEMAFDKASSSKAQSILAVVCTDDGLVSNATQYISERYDSVKVVHVSSMEEYEKVKSNGDLDGWMLFESVLSEDSELHKVYEEVSADKRKKLFISSSGFVNSFEKMQALDGFDDHFFYPLDRFYFIRKLRQAFPEWKIKEGQDFGRKCREGDFEIDTALPIEIHSVSEIHLAFHYYREIRIGDVRRFRFQLPDDPKQEITLQGVCNYNNKISEGKVDCEFILYGLKELDLRFIRQWMIKTNATKDN
ncbi:MAG: hypothetical protein CL677_02440 [Bdellovibrionaceae bacterium]|nr:hypothetical protein [Pseudobdellovibrionaceae bacterium]